MFGIGGWEMLLILVVALLVFGPKRLPELARSLGRGLAEFRRASVDLRKSFDLDLDPSHQPTPDPETLPPAQAGSPASTPTTGVAGAPPDDAENRDGDEAGTGSSTEAEASESAAASADKPSDPRGD